MVEGTHVDVEAGALAAQIISGVLAATRAR